MNADLVALAEGHLKALGEEEVILPVDSDLHLVHDLAQVRGEQAIVVALRDLGEQIPKRCVSREVELGRSFAAKTKIRANHHSHSWLLTPPCKTLYVMNIL